ncbi:MAG: thioesterase [Myxococcales bacterium]|nr:thioesterase [Myxococcota bacterium]MDW8281839.1 thioesterase [Myxococcales bacterium]
MPHPGAVLPEVAVTIEVTEADLASRLATIGTGGGPAGDRFPRVLATARLISLMELASSRAMQPILGEEEMSVGVGVRVEHTAPTPLGGTVRLTARYLGTEGKFHRFEVVAHDDAGEVFRGQHTRAVITAARLEQGAARRLRR